MHRPARGKSEGGLQVMGDSHHERARKRIRLHEPPSSPMHLLDQTRRGLGGFSGDGWRRGTRLQAGTRASCAAVCYEHSRGGARVSAT